VKEEVLGPAQAVPSFCEEVPPSASQDIAESIIRNPHDLHSILPSSFQTKTDRAALAYAIVDQASAAAPTQLLGARVANHANDVFARFPEVLLLYILGYLTQRDLSMLLCVSRAAWRIGQDQRIWQALFQSEHSQQSRLRAQDPSQWKFVCLLEASQALPSLSCFVTKHLFYEDILGIPLTYSISKASNRVSFVRSTFDLLSSEAVFKDHVGRTMWGESFQVWLPMYFNRAHFLRSLPLIQDALVTICAPQILKGQTHNRGGRGAKSKKKPKKQ
jgi:hypothetical protein